MVVFRLVNAEHDPIATGASLTRPSDHSNQKLGSGMYFALDRDSAMQFAGTRHTYDYTHLLRCELVGLEEADFVDLALTPHIVNKSEHGQLPYRERHLAYCLEHDLKGIIWPSRSGWKELCLFDEFIPDTVRIIEAESLPNAAPSANQS